MFHPCLKNGTKVRPIHLIVIVVIAILAAITVVAYNGIARQAKDAVIRTDLQNARVAIENARTLAGGAPPANIRTIGEGAGLSASGANQLFYLRSGTRYCVAAVDPSTGAASHVSDASGAITTGMCSTTVSTVATGWFAVQGVAADGVGNTYVGYAHRVGRITPTGGPMTTLAGSGVAGYADGNGTAAQFNAPDTSFAVAGDGTVYVADRPNHGIRKVASNGDVTTLAGLCGAGNSGMVYGVGTAARFNQPYGIALDASGNVYVADYGNNRIRKIDSTGLVSTFAGTVGGFADGAALTTARFNRPTDLDVDQDGTVYVVDSQNIRIRKITPSGDVTTFAGSGVAGFAEGLGTSA